MKKYAIISMDVEDWYHSYFIDKEVDKSQSLLDGLDVALNIMSQKGIKGSFFVLGEIAEQLANKLRQMNQDGHDIGCHGWGHERPMDLDESVFKQQIIKAKQTLEEILGHSISGYRSPCFGLDDTRLNLVQEAGFQYDSSKLKSQKSTKYGVLTLPGFTETNPCIYKKGNFTEFEVSSQPLGSMNMLLGGGYLRMLPWTFMKRMIQRYLNTGQPYVMYIHPIDLSAKPLPPVKGITLDRWLRTHIGRKQMAWRFKKVIEMLERNGYEFVTFEQLREKI